MKQVIYVPTLHSSLSPAGLPEDLLFICPGLESCPANSFLPVALPFSSHEAGVVLSELMAMGMEFSQNGDLKLIAGQGWLEREEKRKENMRAENAALKKFVEGNQWSRAASSTGLSEISQAEQFKNAQKALLLAWEHEEGVLAMSELETMIADGEKRLKTSLGDGNISPAETQKTGLPKPEYSWRIILDAMGAFLPESAMLFTACGHMIEDLRGQGILEPLPENILKDLSAWPPSLAASLLMVELPLWRILGYAAMPGDRPWLGAAFTLLAAPRLAEN